MNFQIYVSARVQKLFGLRTKNVLHDKKVDLSENWIELWRCDHVVTDPVGAHACLFTNAASYFSLLVSVEKTDFQMLLSNFSRLLMARLTKEKARTPRSIQFQAQMLRGQPRTLIGVMNLQISDATHHLHDGSLYINQIEDSINQSIYGAPDYVWPEKELARLIREKPPFANSEGTHLSGIIPPFGLN